MPDNVDNSHVKFLHQFFPLRATYLGGSLLEWNKRDNVFEKWREQQIFKFIGLVTQNAEDLELGFKGKRVTKVAWAARNLLELAIWIDYCNLSNAHATRFRDDSARDLLGFSKAVQQLEIQKKGAPDSRLEASQTKLVGFAESTLGVVGLGEDFTRVLKAATELGREKEFGALNKLFSKYAHPTSIALNSVVTVDADAGIREMFLLDGIELSTDALTTIRDDMAKHFPQLEKMPGLGKSGHR
jgi:hypothetical protein